MSPWCQSHYCHGVTLMSCCCVCAGFNGTEGEPGVPGEKGEPGETGRKGEPGEPGMKGKGLWQYSWVDEDV